MKLLLDANLSPSLVRRLAARFPGTAHVGDGPGIAAGDLEIWQFAQALDFVIVTKDTDFLDLSMLYGPPPKVIFLRLGNCPTEAIARAMESHPLESDPFFSDPDAGLLVISRGIA